MCYAAWFCMIHSFSTSFGVRYPRAEWSLIWLYGSSPPEDSHHDPYRIGEEPRNAISGGPQALKYSGPGRRDAEVSVRSRGSRRIVPLGAIDRAGRGQ